MSSIKDKNQTKIRYRNQVQKSDKNQVKRQKSGTAIGTKFTPPYACIFMDEAETELQPFLCNLFYGFVVLTTYFLFGLMEHRNWILSLMRLINFINSISFHKKIFLLYNDNEN